MGRVLETFASYGIKIKPSKCEWFRASVSFLGQIVGNDGLRKAPKYVEQAKRFPKQEMVHQLKKFLGLGNFQQKFILHCSAIVSADWGALNEESLCGTLKWTSLLSN